MNMGGKRQFPRVNATRCVAGLLFTWILAFPTRAADVDNLGTSARRIVLRGDYVAYTVLELQEDNTDFNGDGDTNDPVVFIRNIVTGGRHEYRALWGAHLLRGRSRRDYGE